MVLPFEHHIEACIRGEVGDSGLSPDAFARQIERGRPAIRHIRDQLAAGKAAHFGQASRRDDLQQMGDIAARARDRFGRVVVLGTGGSSLGGQSVVALAPRAERERLIFAENLDGRAFAELLDACDPSDTLFLSISKSGSTTETIAQTLAVIGWYDARGHRAMLRDHMIAVCEPVDNVLRRIAGAIGCRTLDHDPGIGGRFSVLSVTGVLPAMIAGLDAQALRTGASQVFEAAISDSDPAPLAGAALNVGLAEEAGRAIQVIMPYVASLERLSHWHRQLWAESLGKEGRGLTPFAALGPVDQHSQLQLWLDGPPDKFFTAITSARTIPGPVLDTSGFGDPALDYLHGQSIGAIVQTQARATIETLVGHGHPVRMIRLPRVDERALGGLFMHFMLETVFTAWLLEVDPYGQPAVETGKVLTRRYLAERGR